MEIHDVIAADEKKGAVKKVPAETNGSQAQKGLGSHSFLWYNLTAMKNLTTERYYSPKQARIPVLIAEKLDISDPVLVFDGIMEEIAIWQYLKPEENKPTGRPGYNRVNKLKTVLFGFMDKGYISLRELEDNCKVNLRYMYLMDGETPCYSMPFSLVFGSETNCSTKKRGTVKSGSGLYSFSSQPLYGTLHQKRIFAFLCYRGQFLHHKPEVKRMTPGLFHYSRVLIE